MKLLDDWKFCAALVAVNKAKLGLEMCEQIQNPTMRRLYTREGLRILHGARASLAHALMENLADHLEHKLFHGTGTGKPLSLLIDED